MSGRIRSIKPEILEDEKTANLPHVAWRLYVSLWVLADDYGNLRGDASYIKGSALWAHPGDDVAEPLRQLDALELIKFYRVRGQVYIHIRGWKKHQKVDHPGKPRIPGPNDSEAETTQSVATDSRDSRETLATDLRSGSPIRDQGSGPRSSCARPRVSRKTRLADDWKPGLVFDADQFAAFRDYHVGRGSTMADWDAAWRTWLRNAKKFAARDARRTSDPRVGRFDPKDANHAPAGTECEL